MSILSLLVGLIIVCVIFWAARAILAAFSIGEPIATVIYVVLVLVVLFWLVNALGATHVFRL